MWMTLVSEIYLYLWPKAWMISSSILSETKRSNKPLQCLLLLLLIKESTTNRFRSTSKLTARGSSLRESQLPHTNQSQLWSMTSQATLKTFTLKDRSSKQSLNFLGHSSSLTSRLLLVQEKVNGNPFRRLIMLTLWVRYSISLMTARGK